MLAAGGGGAEVEDEGSADVVAEVAFVASLEDLLSSWSLDFGEPRGEEALFLLLLSSRGPVLGLLCCFWLSLSEGERDRFLVESAMLFLIQLFWVRRCRRLGNGYL